MYVFVCVSIILDIMLLRTALCKTVLFIQRSITHSPLWFQERKRESVESGENLYVWVSLLDLVVRRRAPSICLLHSQWWAIQPECLQPHVMLDAYSCRHVKPPLEKLVLLWAFVDTHGNGMGPPHTPTLFQCLRTPAQVLWGPTCRSLYRWPLPGRVHPPNHHSCFGE